MTPVQWKWHFTYLRKACYKLYDCYWLFVCFKCLNDCLNYENVSKCDNYLIDAFFYSNVYLLYKTVHTCTMYYERIKHLLNYFDIYQTVFFMFLFSVWMWEMKIFSIDNVTFHLFMGQQPSVHLKQRCLDFWLTSYSTE